MIRISLLLVYIMFACLPAFAKTKTINVDKILSLHINSSINPATYNYLQVGTEKAKAEWVDLILIKMNTPGGLISTTKDILELIGSSDIPIAIWITPEGASATSAGAIIASGAHILLMSSGTNMGAATPIELSGQLKEGDIRNKAVNDLVALVQSLAETRNRNAKLFGKMIKDAASFKAKEAKQKKLIDGIVNSQEEFIEFLHNKSIIIKGEKLKLNIQKAKVVEAEMDLGQKLLNIFANPNLAYILFLLGAALIYLELQAPGGFIAGSIGVISLILAGIGFQVLPVNFGAFGLIVLSFILFILEVYITSYGILSLAGLASLIFGSLFLFRTDNAYIELSQTIVISAVSAVALFIAFIAFFFIRDVIKSKPKKFFSLAGHTCTISGILPGENGLNVYQVRVSGETWKAMSDKEFKVGDKCPILEEDTDNMSLKI